MAMIGACRCCWRRLDVHTTGAGLAAGFEAVSTARAGDALAGVTRRDGATVVELGPVVLGTNPEHPAVKQGANVDTRGDPVVEVATHAAIPTVPAATTAAVAPVQRKARLNPSSVPTANALPPSFKKEENSRDYLFEINCSGE